jgi:hypothetical protein
MRAVPLGSLALVAGLAAAPTIITVARSGSNLDLALIVAALLSGAGLAYAVDDDAAALLASSPTTLAARRTARIVAAAFVIAVGWFLLLLTGSLAGLRLHGDRFRDLATEAFTAAGIGLAVAATLRRELSVERAGLIGAAAAVLAMVFVTSLSMRYSWMPALGNPQHHDNWLWLAVAAWAGVCWTARDPAGPHG